MIVGDAASTRALGLIIVLEAAVPSMSCSAPDLVAYADAHAHSEDVHVD